MRLCTARMSSHENVASLFRQPRPLSPHWTTHSIGRTRQSFPRFDVSNPEAFWISEFTKVTEYWKNHSSRRLA
jgi:hypothetical protein